MNKLPSLSGLTNNCVKRDAAEAGEGSSTKQARHSDALTPDVAPLCVDIRVRETALSEAGMSPPAKLASDMLFALFAWLVVSEAHKSYCRDFMHHVWERFDSLMDKATMNSWDTVEGATCCSVVQKFVDDPEHTPDAETIASLKCIVQVYLTNRNLPPDTRAVKDITNHLHLFEEYIILGFGKMFRRTVRAYVNVGSRDTDKSCVGMIMVSNRVSDSFTVQLSDTKPLMRVEGIVTCPFFLHARRTGKLQTKDEKGVADRIFEHLVAYGIQIRSSPLESAHAWRLRLIKMGVKDLNGEPLQMLANTAKQAEREREKWETRAGE